MTGRPARAWRRPGPYLTDALADLVYRLASRYGPWHWRTRRDLKDQQLRKDNP